MKKKKIQLYLASISQSMLGFFHSVTYLPFPATPRYYSHIHLRAAKEKKRAYSGIHRIRKHVLASIYIESLAITQMLFHDSRALVSVAACYVHGIAVEW